MNDYIEVSERTVEDALTEAKIRLGAASDEIEYEIIEKGSNGFLGMGAKNAIIKVRKKIVEDVNNEEFDISDNNKFTSNSNINDIEIISDNDKNTPSDSLEEQVVDVDETIEKATKFLSAIFEDLSLNVCITSQYDADENTLMIELSADEMGMLIGKRGQTLDAIQYLTSLAVNKDSKYYVHIKIDTENYRQRRKLTLENLAKNIASKVKRTNHSVKLEPMTPYERRIIHYALQADKFVTTHSEGSDPHRRIIVAPKKQQFRR